jgi:Protein of unknown function (DUF3293)
MQSTSLIGPTTLQAYRETEYRVHNGPGFVLRVGEFSEVLMTEHKRHKVDCSAFITAGNPFSAVLDDAANQDRQASLAHELTQRSLSFLPGMGEHPTNGWEGESSYLVFGLNLEAAKALGQRFEQNAVIWCGSDAIPQLILLR